MKNLALGLLGSLALVQVPVDRLAPLKADADLAKFFWSERSSPDYAPFVLAAGATSAQDTGLGEEIETSFAAPLKALGDLWRTEWAQPLGLKPNPATTQTILAFLPSFDLHKEIAAKRFPAEEIVPPSFLVGDILVGYHRGNAFESKLARRHAVLARAAERLVALYRPEGGGKSLSPWLEMGLATYLSEIRERDSGREGTIYVREESPDWRQALGRAADALREMQIAPPTFEELLKFSPEKMTNKHYREFVRLSGYATILLYRTQQTERFAKPFLSYLKDEFQGEGSPERFRARLQTFAVPFAKEWESFCGLAVEPAKPVATKPNTNPTSNPQPAPSNKAPAIASPIPLELTPRTVLDLRAEVLRKARSRRFDEALHEVYDVREKQSDILKPFLAVEKRLIDVALNIYETFAKSAKPGDKLPAGFGPVGEIVAIDPNGSFEIREKYSTKKYPWTALSLQAVATHVYTALKRNGPEETLDYATCLLLCGNLEAAKEALKSASKSGAPPERLDQLSKMIPSFEAALKEAKARDALEEISAMEPAYAAEKIRQRLLDPDIRASAAWSYARPYLEGALSQFFAGQFDKKGLPSLFRGKAKAEGGGHLKIQYSFDEEAQIADWVPCTQPALAKMLASAATQASTWGVQMGRLSISSSGARAHLAPWTGDIAVTVSCDTIEREDAKTGAYPGLIAGILDDGKGSFVCNDGTGGVRRFYPDGRSPRDGAGSPEDLPRWEGSKPHQIKVARTGPRVYAMLDGKEIGSLEEKERKSGRVFLFASGDVNFLVGEISIAGKIDTESTWYQENKANWVHKEVFSVLGE